MSTPGYLQWCRLTPETTWGTYNVANTPVWPRLDQNNSFVMKPRPVQKVIRSADGGNRPRQMRSARTAVAGTLNTLLYPSQAGALLSWALGITSNDVASMTADWHDGTRERRFTGVKVDELTFSGDDESDLVRVSLKLTGKTVGTPDGTFLLSNAVYPDEACYVFQESATHLAIGGTRTAYSSLGLTVANVLKGHFHESQYLNVLAYCGRTVTAKVKSQYVASTDQDNWEAETALTVSVGFVRDANNSITLTLNSRNFLTGVDDELPIDDLKYQTLDLTAFYDPGAGTPTDVSGSVVYNGGSPVTF
jgi:hypothetical protein